MKRRTKRLDIRPLESKDYDAWVTAHTSMTEERNRWDAANRKPEALTRAKFRKLLNENIKYRKTEKFFDFGIFVKQTGELVGAVALMDINRGVFQNAYLGYRIFNRHWSNGYGYEAASAAIDIAFNELKLHRVEAGIAPGNIRSIRLARALGMRREGLSKRRLFLQNKWQDMLLYALTLEDKGKRWRGETLHVKRS